MAKDKPKKSGKPEDAKEQDSKSVKPVRDNHSASDSSAKDSKDSAKSTSTDKSAAKDAKDTKDAKDVKDSQKSATVKSTNDSAKDVKAKTSEKPAVISSATLATLAPSSAISPEHPMKGFFAKKCAKDENILTIFRTPKIWGALMGEAIGTMFLVMLMLCLGWQNTLYVGLSVIVIYAVIVGLSGAHLNPIVTAGMMATRRVSAIRGILYILAQLLGGWVALIIVNAFRLGSETTAELPVMDGVTLESFIAVALVELLGACVIGFCFARSLRYARRQPLAFAFIMASSIILTAVFGIVISSYFSPSGYTFIYNPITALMFQILPTQADDISALLSSAGLALAAYVLVPVIGGIIGFYVADVATRLSCGGYFCEIDEPTLILKK